MKLDEPVSSISNRISNSLRTQKFQPLADGFSEDDARLYVFLYQSRCPNPDSLHAKWSGRVTKADVQTSVRTSEAVADFWRRASWKAPSETYSTTEQQPSRDQ